VFDNDVDPKLAREFLADPHHHIAVALDNGVVVGFASAVDYIHPDKPRELWVNEVGTAPTHQGQGIAKRVMVALLAHGKALGCTVAWVLTDKDNTAARALYKSAGGSELSTEVVHVEWEL
jgi:aminoglycoside 6'-N-acetyltransferase I